jgi:hypothetical protein
MAKAEASPRVLRNDLLPRLELAHVPLERLKMPAREVRKLHPAHVRQVADSIGALGFCAPIIIGKDNLVLDGAARVEAARSLGLGHLPCVRIEHLSRSRCRRVAPREIDRRYYDDAGRIISAKWLWLKRVGLPEGSNAP